MYLFDHKRFDNLFYFIEWIRYYKEDPELFEVEFYTLPRGEQRKVLWVWLKDVEEPLEDSEE